MVKTGTLVGLVGAGGYGREVMPSLREQISTSNGVASNLLFLVEGASSVDQEMVNGVSVAGLDEFLEHRDNRLFNVAIGDSKVRERIALHCIEEGAVPLSITDRTVRLLDDCNVGEGAILSPFVTITSNVRIGRFFHANLYSYVAHDCVIGDFVTFAPGVQCNGWIHIHDHAYIGTGAVLRPGVSGKPLVIGAGAVVGMGAVVTKDVAPGQVVVGNPAAALVRK